MENDREIIVSPLAFHSPKVAHVPYGATIQEIVAVLSPDLYVIVEIDGVPIPRDKWSVVPSVDSHVLISVPLHGGDGKNPLRTLLTIAVIVAAVALAVPTGGASLWLAGATGLSAATAGTIIGMTVMTAGMLLVNAIAPIKYGSSAVSAAQSYNNSDTYSIGASSNKKTRGDGSGLPWNT